MVAIQETPGHALDWVDVQEFNLNYHYGYVVKSMVSGFW